MRLLILLMIMCSNTAWAFSQSCDTWLSKSQIYTINKAYRLGVEHDLGYSLAAIAFLESSAGVHLRNERTQDYGVFGINIRTVTKRLHQLTGVTLNDKQIKSLKSHLMFDMESNAMYAIMELRFWQRVHGQNNWKPIWASYNGGYSYSNDRPQTYSRSVAKTIRKIKQLNCLELN